MKNKTTKPNWLIYTRGYVPFYRVGLLLDCLKEKGRELNGIELNVAFATQGAKCIFAWDKNEIDYVFNRLLKKINNRDKGERHFKKMKAFSAKALNSAEQIRNFNLAKFSKKKLISSYLWMRDNCAEAYALMFPDIDAFDVCFENYLKEKLRKEINKNFNETNFINFYNNLTAPLCQTFILQEEKEIIKLALKSKIKTREIDNIYDKYWWANLGWENMDPRSKDYYMETARKFSKKKDLKKKLINMDENITAARKKREKLIKKFRLSEEFGHYLKIIDEYSYLHDLRKEMQVRTLYSFELLLIETARRLKLDKEKLERFWHQEIILFLSGKKISAAEIKKREEAQFIRVSKNNVFILSERKAAKIIKQELCAVHEKITEIKGRGVSSGRVTAPVKICSGAREALEKIKDGDILVCGMTLPDYVQAMRKAAAIITDEGGLTCHAAILSRELNKPCVIGTKIATRVLHDGQIVEVDAAKGVIKIKYPL